MESEKFAIPGAIVIAGLIIAAAIIYKDRGGAIGPTTVLPSGEQTQNERIAVSADDDPYLGNPNAPVTIIEFSDFQCPFCRKSWRDVIPQLTKDYIETGKVKFVYRDFPLDFHEGAQPAAEGAECARDKGKFWEMHNKIFGEQDKQGQGTISFTKDDVKRWAKELGLDTNKFNSCLDSGKYTAEVKKDFQDGVAAGVNGTPTFFVNGIPIKGAQPYSVFIDVIEEELKTISP